MTWDIPFAERARQARRVDLYSFLIRYHSNDIIQEGRFLRLKCDTSIVVKEGYSGYSKYNEPRSTGHGNGIDLLSKYLGYSRLDAVFALSKEYGTGHQVNARSSAPVKSTTLSNSSLFPERSDSSNRVLAYLTKTRGLSYDTVKALIQAGLLYQDVPYSNAVFINHEQNFCEIRGTCSYTAPFHGCRSRKDSSAYWSFRIGHGDLKEVYICESAIDAISLYELHRLTGSIKSPVMYCSIGGVGKQATIEHIASGCTYRTILAVDSDEAGMECRRRNSQLDQITPQHKDWNEDLLAIRTRSAGVKSGMHLS